MVPTLKTKWLPSWDNANTMDNVDQTAPSLYTLTHLKPPKYNTLGQSDERTASRQPSSPATANNNKDQDNSNKKQQVLEQMDKMLYHDLLEVRRALDLFLNSQIDECLM
ncbi:unnamed protein product [Cunninghamella echinulata]